MVVRVPSGGKTLPPQPPPAETEVPRSQPPQLHASAELTRKGQTLLDQGRVDAAIREFERAVSLNPNNGQGYYHLARAWMVKGDFRQADSFHQLAEIHLQDEPGWASRLKAQKADIQKGLDR